LDINKQDNPTTTTRKMALEAIRFNPVDRSLEILDQLRLPYETVYVPIKTTEDGYDAIKRMVVRGAPAIAIVGMLSIAVDINKSLDPKTQSAEMVARAIAQKLDYIVDARPTAVNLSQAARELGEAVARVRSQGKDSAGLIETFISRAVAMLDADVADNRAIGSNGLKYMEQFAPDLDKFSIVTICNTGSLATAGYGTALGIIRSVFAANKLDRAYALETRPYNQGSRLTAFELVYDKIPSTLITDSMASSLLRAHPEIRYVVVGADRVAANGDTANKIGTYQLAVVAKHHGVKFIVAAPSTSIDLNTASGDDIVIEQRPAKELSQVRGAIVDPSGIDKDIELATVSVAAPGIDVWNPAFDVTPASLIDAIVSEKGVAVKGTDGAFDLKSL
jgi:methylthioribose-1-phosphate isomerase